MGMDTKVTPSRISFIAGLPVLRRWSRLSWASTPVRSVPWMAPVTMMTFGPVTVGAAEAGRPTAAPEASRPPISRALQERRDALTKRCLVSG